MEPVYSGHCLGSHLSNVGPSCTNPVQNDLLKSSDLSTTAEILVPCMTILYRFQFNSFYAYPVFNTPFNIFGAGNCGIEVSIKLYTESVIDVVHILHRNMSVRALVCTEVLSQTPQCTQNIYKKVGHAHRIADSL